MRTMQYAALCLVFGAYLAGCNDNKPESAADYDRRAGHTRKTTKTPPPMSAMNSAKTPAAMGADPHAQPNPAAAGGVTGVVLETMDASKYTYMRIKAPQGELWAASPKIAVKVGETVNLQQLMPMHDFHSKTLNRTFKEIFFVSRAVIVKGDADAKKAADPANNASAKRPAPPHPMGGAAASPPHPMRKTTEVEPVKAGDVAKLPNGYTVAELFAKKSELAGKTVHIRAKIVKATPNIMGKNWLHIQDGTGQKGANDITVTSTGPLVKEGTLVLVEGVLRIDVDLGSGYFFPVLIENATISPQPDKTPVGGA